jgi:hypothetical protein
MKTMFWTPAAVAHPARPLSYGWRYAVADLLRVASFLLARAARRLRTAEAAAQASAIPRGLPVVEFSCIHHDAGAPEGALYVDGELVAILPGVIRL